MRTFLATLGRSIVLFWRGVDQTRRFAVNVLFLFLLALLISLLLVDVTLPVPDSAVLVVSPYGDLVEQMTRDPEEDAILVLSGERRPETLMRPILEALEYAAEDERVKVVLLDLDRLGRAGLSKLQELRQAVETFRETGKSVIATGDFYTQSQYYLASTADEIYMHPMGLVLVTGYGSYRNYYKKALDELEIDWNVFRIGEYKSAVEPFLRSDMSPEDRASRQRYLSMLWQAYSDDVERARDLDPGLLQRYATGFSDALTAHGGSAGELALTMGLVDHLAHRDEVRQRLIELVGEDEESKSFHQIDYGSYLAAVRESDDDSDDVIAVVVARGGIYDGRRAAGSIGGDSTARLLRQARESEEVKAVVLRVDSPGGSAFAAEIIRREVELIRQAGKPVIASMSSVAASGGYLISTTADEIWAAPTTITGSIGIYSMIPTFERTLGKLGVHNDGVGTGDLAGTLRFERSLPEEGRRAMQLLTEQGYRDFVDAVASGRNKTQGEVEGIGRGRVWIGSDALDHGLVDHLGGLDESIAAAANLAELGDDYRRVFFEQERDWRERLLSWFVLQFGERLGLERPLGLGFEAAGWQDLISDLTALDRFGDPNGLYSYCFCEPN